MERLNLFFGYCGAVSIILFMMSSIWALLIQAIRFRRGRLKFRWDDTESRACIIIMAVSLLGSIAAFLFAIWRIWHTN